MSRKHKCAAFLAFISLVPCLALLPFVIAADQAKPSRITVSLGHLVGAGTVTTTVAKNLSQPGYTLNGTLSFVGVQPTSYESTLDLSTGTAGVLVTGGIASVPSPENLQVFYALLDNTSGTINFFSSTAGTGAVGTPLVLQPRSPYEWDQGGSTTGGTATSTPWGGEAFQSFTLTTAGTSNVSGGTTTGVHIHGSLSQ